MIIKCANCNKEVIAKRTTKRFCSKECTDSFSYKPKEKKGKLIECGYCKKQIYVRQYRLKKFKTLFCNREHAILFKQEKSFNSFCIICGKKFFCQPCQMIYRHRKTCSKECRSKLQTLKAKENRIKKGFSKHQIDRCIRYSKDLDIWRKGVFVRDNYTCQKCKKTGGYLEAHHIKPFAFFPELRFELSNGETLCKKCHNKTKTPFNKLRKKYNGYQESLKLSA
jgi:5-methylcytosine-specific restriction endonuclease McrA